MYINEKNKMTPVEQIFRIKGNPLMCKIQQMGKDAFFVPVKRRVTY